MTGALHADLVALDGDGTVDWVLPLLTLEGVAVAGDTVFAVGTDTSTTGPGGRTLFARSDSSSWRADVSSLEGRPVVAGGLVYVSHWVAGGADVAIFDVDGCGGPDCDELMVLDIPQGGGGLYGMSVANGTLFVHKAGPGAHLSAYRP